MPMPKISVIIPIYNCEESLRRCMESVCYQLYTDLEIICINDGSSDNSLEIMKEFAQLDHRIVVIDKLNEGVSRARNTGLSVCTGDYVLFVDADDYISEDFIQRLYVAIGSKHDVAVCGYTEINEDTSMEIFDYRNCNNKDDFILHCIQNTGGVVCSKLYRTSLLREYRIQFDETLSLSEDLIFALQSFIKAQSIVAIENAGYFYDRRCENTKNIDYLERLKKSLLVHDKVLNLLKSHQSAQKDRVLNKREGKIVYTFLNALVVQKKYGEFSKAFIVVNRRMLRMKFDEFDGLNRLWLILYRNHHIHLAYFACRIRIVLVKALRKCHMKKG